MVPTFWDETRVLVDRVGELLVTARRKGEEWYLGGLSAGESKTVEIPLSFLGAQNYTAQIWKDAPESEKNPNEIRVEQTSAGKQQALKIFIAADGGFASRFSPTK